MRYLALATDYDGTLATHGSVDDSIIRSLERFVASGRKLIMVTGRQLEDLMNVFGRLDLFCRVVCENGAVIYRPEGHETRVLCDPPDEHFVEELAKRGVAPIAVGRAIVATWQPNETLVFETMRDCGLELQVTFNKGAVMVLPSGVNKGTGLKAALKEIGLSQHNVVGIGDAENDHAFLNVCECAVAVENALIPIKDHADLITTQGHGKGVVEVIDGLLKNDLSETTRPLSRHHVLLGYDHDGTGFMVKPYGTGILIAGPSGSGKSTTAIGFLERLSERRYQFCLIDPEGDYHSVDSAIVLGTQRAAPSQEEVLQVLKNPSESVVVNLLGVPLADRPLFFAGLMTRIQELRARTGRPHWLVLDEAHHLLPYERPHAVETLPRDVGGSTLMITVHPEHMAPEALAEIDITVAVGLQPRKTLAEYARARGIFPPGVPRSERGEVIAWRPGNTNESPIVLRVPPPHAEFRRHRRKYALGELPPEQSFFFKGPEGKLNLRAQNLMLFAQMADGVDDATYEFHLQQKDYSHWFLNVIKDETLAAVAAKVEQNADLSLAEGRNLIKQEIERRYTLPE